MHQHQKYFNVLGIAPTNDKSIIKKAYRKLAFKYHPDKNPSPQAQSKFIEVTDAYEIVTGVQKAPNNKLKTESEGPTDEERIKAAKKRYQKAKQKELEEEAAFYLQMIRGKKWKFIKFFGIASAVCSLLLFVDYYAPAKSKTTLVSEMYVDSNYGRLFFEIASSNYYFDYEAAIEVTQYPLIEATTTPIFNDLKYIRFIGRNGKHTAIEPVFTILSVYPLIPILLLIPFFTLWYKRPNALFTVLHLVSTYFIPFVFLFAMFSNWRIFQIFN